VSQCKGSLRDCGLDRPIEEYLDDIEALKEKWICDILSDDDKTNNDF